MSEDKDKVTDINEAKGEEPAVPAQQLPPTHQAMPLTLVNQILKYLRKQPMEEVEDLVAGMRDQSVPLALTNKQPQQ